MRNKEFALPIIIGLALAIVLSSVSFYINWICGLICIILSMSLMLIFIVYTEMRYKRIGELNDYLANVVAGNYDMNIAQNEEGELSLLENNILKVISALKNSNEIIHNDKIYLADSLADISHQLKTPLTSMMVITDLLKEEKKEDKRTEFVSIIESQCEKMKWLISNLLKLSKLDTGTITFKSENLDIADVINESLKPFEITLDLKNIRLNNSTRSYLFNGDMNWCIEAFGNIIKNCIEHTADGGTIKMYSASNNLYIQLIIEDDGCGISEEDLPHIFERFYHGKNSSSDSVGIGLALSKEILNKQNASISVESKSGVGTKFDIRFYKSII